MAPGYPNNVLAGSQGTSAILTVGGLHPRTKRRYVSYETVAGGMGARPNQDGINSVKVGISNTMNSPVEQIEMRFPIMIDRYELINDSGGPGKYRGGLGARRVTRVMGHTAMATTCCERMTSAPFGLRGGMPGAVSRIQMIDKEGNKSKVAGKGPPFAIGDGSEIWYDVAGSGGYGSPEQRDPGSPAQGRYQRIRLRGISLQGLRRQPRGHALPLLRHLPGSRQVAQPTQNTLSR